MSGWPGTAGSGEAVLAMDKSAASKMGVTTVIWLLSGLGSVEELEIFAVLEMVPEALAERVPRRKMVTEEPAANVPRETFPVQFVQDCPWLTLYSTRESRLDVWSESSTEFASKGPWLATVMV